VTVFSYDPAPEGAAYQVAPLPAESFFASPVGRRLVMGYLGNFLALHPGFRECDAIIAHGDSLLFPLLGKPLVRIMHGSALMEAVSARSLPRRIAQLGVYAQELLTALTQQGTVAVSRNSKKLNPFLRQVIPNGVDLKVFRPGEEKSAFPSVLFVGTLDGRKRGSRLLDWFSQVVAPAHPRAELWMVTPEGPSVPGVRYFPAATTRELVSLYQRAWIFASPSRYEGFGLPYLEAMACGTPVVATMNPGSQEVLGEGRYGCLTTDADFPGTLNRLLSDEAERTKLARRGLMRAKAFDLERTVDAYETWILELRAKA
jgi:glycosyltransferase involved in cell wall biosynthesis